MALKLTKEQQSAIDAEGRVIVSAAAGSGKTAVLVERIIKRFTDKDFPLSADRALIVTFTNSAAAELKSKIENRLKSMLAENPKDALLRRQNILIKIAPIGTIDSFCINLVRENFNLLSISRDFKIADGTETETLYAELLDEFVNEKLSLGDEEILKALEYTKQGYDAAKLKKIIAAVYEKSRSVPYPKKWLSSFYENFVSEYSDFENTAAVTAVFSKCISLADNSIKYADEILKFSADELFLAKHSQKIVQYIEFCDKIKTCAENSDWDALYQAANASLSALPQRNWTKDYRTSKNVQRLSDERKKLLSFLKSNVYADKSANIAVLKTYSQSVKTISGLISEYSQKIEENALASNTFTFDQIEHFALRLLTEFDVVRKDCNARYDAILVDECQDTNNLQDEIFEILSSENNRLFMVGDVKQSIYAFRNANPDNFLKRKDTYPDFAPGLEKSRVLLNANFRSRKEICDFINYIFCTYMTKESADIEYKNSDMLNPLGVFGTAADTPVELLLNEYGENNKYDFEAKTIANFIYEKVESGYTVKDTDNTVRPVKYSDFAVLLRGNTHISDYVKALAEYSIPVNININDFSNTVEIKTALALLKCIDDFRDDISLFTVLVSPLFRFTNKEIAEIRQKNKFDTLFSNLIAAAENGNLRAARVCEKLREFAAIIAVMPLCEFINRIFSELSVIDIFSAFEDGEVKRANLLLFTEYAAEFNNKSGKKLREFIRFIESDTKNSLSANITSGEDAVTISTIHKSKGLQYPVCILGGLTAQIRKSGVTEGSKVICDDTYGFLFDCYCPELKATLKPITKNYVSDLLTEKLYKEELRLLYVALTRASDKLLLCVSVKNAEEYLEQSTKSSIEFSNNGIPFSKDALFSCNSYAQWLVAAMLYHRCGTTYRRSEIDYGVSEYPCEFSVTLNNTLPKTPNGFSKEIKQPAQINTSEVKKAFAFDYRYSDIFNLPAKTSVTDILKQNKTLELAFKAKPSFVFKEGISAPEKGTATHKFMCYCDYSLAEKSIESEIERLLEWQFISQSDADVIERDCVRSFFESDVYSLIKSADKVYREYRFLSKINASCIDANIKENDEYCIVQGVADCVIEYSDSIIIVDFKTDNITSEQILCEQYKKQLQLYETALTETLKKPVRKKILFSFKMRKAIEVK